MPLSRWHMGLFVSVLLCLASLPISPASIHTASIPRGPLGPFVSAASLASTLRAGSPQVVPASQKVQVSLPPVPQVTANAAIVIEYPSGRILFQKNAHARMAPASTTKILTAILALESGRLNDVVTIAPRDLVPGTSMGLHGGEKQTLGNLLYGMLLPSGNDAATAIADYLGTQANPKAGSQSKWQDPLVRFAGMMNAKVVQLGLKDSHFVNPHGLDAYSHYASAYDLASLTWYASHFELFDQIVKQQNYTAPGHPLKNLNKLLTRYPGADGVKTGFTDYAGLCLVSSATRNAKHIIAVALNAPRAWDDGVALLDYGFAASAALSTKASIETLSVAAHAAGFQFQQPAVH